MEFKDTGTLELKAQTSEFDKKLKELNNNATALKKTLKEIEATGGKGSEEWKKTKLELKATREEAEKMAKSMKGMDVGKMTLQQLEQHSRALNKELKQLEPGTKAFIETAKRLGEVDKQMGAVKNQVKGIKDGGEQLAKPTMWDKISGGVNKVNLAFKAIIALQVIQWAVDLGKSIFGTTQKLEKYETVLGTALKSQKQAKESMAALKDIAAKTPFSVDVLTEAYVKMVNRGLRPTREQMLSMGDVASALGKPMEAVNEAILDVSNTERWNELGIKVQKSGDKIIGTFKGQKVTMDATEEGALKMVAAFGKMEGVAGQNAEMMTKLEGKTSNLGDTFMQLAGAVGEQLKPLFYALLGVVIEVANFLLELAKNSEPVVVVFKTLWRQVSSLFDSLMSLVLQVFPSLNKQTVSASGVMKTLGIVFQTLLLPLKLLLLNLQLVTDALATLFNGGKALVKFLQGDFAGASKAWDATKVQATKMKDHVISNFEEIKKGYKAAMVDNPKKLEPEAVLAAATTEGKKQKAISEEQKKAAEKREKEAEKNRKKEEKAEAKHLEDIAKANEEALKKIAEYEAETNITSIKDELLREIAKIDEKARKRKAEVNETLADEKLKEKQRTVIDKEAEAERQKIKNDFEAKAAKKQEEAASKRLENNNFVIEQERKAEGAMLDWKELQAGNNAHKLAEIKKERLNLELKYTKEKLDAELAAEKAKAEREITNAEDKEKTLKALESRYNNEKKAQTEKYSQDIAKIDKDLIDGKASKQKAWSDVFSNFLKGDVAKAIDAAGQIVQGELAAWQKRLQNNLEKYNTVGQMAQQAASFLADVEKAKADKAIAEAYRERDAKLAVYQAEIDEKQAKLDIAIEREAALKEALNQASNELDKKKIEEKIKNATNEKNKLLDVKKQLEASVKAENDKARAIEKQEKTKAWEAQKRADMASAIISGALASVKALASAFFPLNLVFAAMAATMTGIQVAKISSQTPPSFHYGFTPQGSKHEATYGRGGIALIDNKTGHNLGEMEGGEAIVNAEQTEINQPIIQQMHENAKRGVNRPVWETMKFGRSLAFRDGIPSFRSPAFEGRMYQYGGTVGKRFENGINSFPKDATTLSGGEVQRNADEQIKLLREQNESLKQLVEQNNTGNLYVLQTRDAVKQNVEATKSVEDTIRQGVISQKLDYRISVISSLSRAS